MPRFEDAKTSQALQLDPYARAFVCVASVNSDRRKLSGKERALVNLLFEQDALNCIWCNAGNMTVRVRSQQH